MAQKYDIHGTGTRHPWRRNKTSVEHEQDNHGKVDHGLEVPNLHFPKSYSKHKHFDVRIPKYGENQKFQILLTVFHSFTM